MTLIVDLTIDQSRKLEETAQRLNMTVGELARVAINELLARQDDEFESIVDCVLTKNAELYRRLA